MTEENCIFCNIITGKDKEATIVFEVLYPTKVDINSKLANSLFSKKDETVVILKDRFPAASNHYLVLPRRHIKNAKTLTSEDVQLRKYF